MRSLGEFFGHIARAIKTDPAKSRGGSAEPKRERRVVSERVEEREVPNPPPDGSGRMILRRTVIEEVEIEGRGDVSSPHENAPPSHREHRGGTERSDERARDGRG